MKGDAKNSLYDRETLYRNGIMKGKNFFITGATDGIGRETAKALARQGATLYILCRNPKKGEAFSGDLLRSCPNSVGGLYFADLGDFDQVRGAAAEFLRLGKSLDGLINNAGILNTSRVILSNGQEQMFAVNHLGHFLLTDHLMPALKASKQARIVVVASGAYKLCKGIRFDDLTWERDFKPFKAYGHSKLANILFMRSLAKRLHGSAITVNALHPGEVSTQLGAHNAWWARVLIKLFSPFLQAPVQGAKTSVYLAQSPDLKEVSGEYFVNCRRQRTKPWASDAQEAERLWKVSCEICQNHSATK